ncbi:hypothetical protein [Streptomyces sp900116325]|uniref:MmyB-like transcription regulator ligand binding domain-containing protein n=1 Tax=Streptomyces sp. 900116325 TaxID=3154295 RepID=A0ABV2UP20_9ACTN
MGLNGTPAVHVDLLGDLPYRHGHAPRRLPSQVLAEEFGELSDGGVTYSSLSCRSMKKRNFVRLGYCEPAIGALDSDWGWVARTTLAQPRMEFARDPKDPRLAELSDRAGIARGGAGDGDHLQRARTT